MSVSINLANKRVLVTGGGNGIGRALCQKLHSQGASVVALDRNQDWLTSLKKECPGTQTICVDLEDWQATRTALNDLEVVDCLVNNAGIGLEENFMNTTSANFDKTMNINVKAIINVSQVIAQKLIASNRGGSIVNISSLASRFGTRQSVSYNLSKAAVDMLTKSMAVELGPKNIRVNSVNPIIIMTDLAREFLDKEPGTTIKRNVINRTPMGRICDVNEVVNTILFLLSDLAPMIHGEQLYLDGGYSAF